MDLQIPDVDALIHTADFPCIKKTPDVQARPVFAHHPSVLCS